MCLYEQQEYSRQEVRGGWDSGGLGPSTSKKELGLSSSSLIDAIMQLTQLYCIYSATMQAEAYVSKTISIIY